MSIRYGRCQADGRQKNPLETGYVVITHGVGSVCNRNMGLFEIWEQRSDDWAIGSRKDQIYNARAAFVTPFLGVTWVFPLEGDEL